MRNGHLCMLIQVYCILLYTLGNTDGACTFPEAIRGNWISSEKGTLNFTADTLWNYPVFLYLNINSASFTCTEQSGNKYFLQSTETVFIFSNLNVYLCLEFAQISEYKFTYQVANVFSESYNPCPTYIPTLAISESLTVWAMTSAIHPTNLERVYVADSSVSVAMETGCNRAEPYETATVNVLVKEGASEAGLTEGTCPYDILHTYANGSLTSVDGSKTCVNATMNVCEDISTRMIQTYDPSCDSSLKFASEGTYTCLHDIADETAGVTYLHVWNNDTTLATGVNRINCYAFEAVDQTMVATLYPGACLISQTPTVVTAPGIVVEYNTITNTCRSEDTTVSIAETTVESGTQIVYIVAIVFGSLSFILIIIATVIVIIKTKCRCITKLCKKNSKIGHSDVSITPSMANKLDLKEVLREQPHSAFVPRKPIKLKPITQPYFASPPKVELLFEVEPRVTSGRRMFRSSVLLSQQSLQDI